jgi:4-hydroxybenzoate polyprenyltransferase
MSTKICSCFYIFLSTSKLQSYLNSNDLRMVSISVWMYSIWLFTFSDLKTIIAPSTAFAILSQLGSESFGIRNDVEPPFSLICMKTITAALWAWINLLPFAIDNQRRAESIEEDRRNKPWRPLPSGYLTPGQAKRMMLSLYPVAFFVSTHLGAASQSVLLLGFGFWYNDLNGADASWLVRNFINCCGFMCFLSGALQTALQQPLFSNKIFVAWLTIIGAVVFSTVHIQDLADQVGDRVRGRWTAPLILGDGAARWTVVIPMSFWCFFCPYFWQLPTHGYLLSVLLGSAIILRTLFRRSVKDDKVTFQLWNLWLVSLYSLPLLVP